MTKVRKFSQQNKFVEFQKISIFDAKIEVISSESCNFWRQWTQLWRFQICYFQLSISSNNEVLVIFRYFSRKTCHISGSSNDRNVKVSGEFVVFLTLVRSYQKQYVGWTEKLGKIKLDVPIKFYNDMFKAYFGECNCLGIVFEHF